MHVLFLSAKLIVLYILIFFSKETFEIGEDDGVGGLSGGQKVRRKKKPSLPRSVVNPDGNFYFYWLMILTFCVLYNLWTLIVRESFPELQVSLVFLTFTLIFYIECIAKRPW